MVARLSEWRMSLVWVQTLADLFRSPPPSGPLGFIADESAYRKAFDGLQAGSTRPDGLGFAWPGPYGHHFWQFYLDGYAPGDITGRQAWQGLVPLRLKFRAQLSIAATAGGNMTQLTPEAFFYPHGVGLVVTARFVGDFGLDDWAEAAVRLHHRPQIDLTIGQQLRSAISMLTAADLMLSAIRTDQLGPTTKAGPRSTEPFTVTTVIRGTGIDPDAPAAEGSPEHRALEAVINFSESWKTDSLAPLADRTLTLSQTKPRRSGHVVVGRKRARGVWLPGWFTDTTPARHTLSCYHRNLVLASLQVESLGEFARATVNQLHDGPTTVNGLPLYWRKCAQRAAGALGRLYSGANSYRSWSARLQMEQNDLVPVTTELRAAYNMAPLR